MKDATSAGRPAPTATHARILDADVDRILSADLPWEKFAGAAVMVTGASGFLPSYMVETLLAMKAKHGCGPDRIIALVRSEERFRERFSRHLDRPELILLRADISAPIRVDGPLDFVVHAASPATPRAYLRDPLGVIRANVEGTRNSLEVAEAHRARFMLFSSGEVYGQTAHVPTAEHEYGIVDPMAVRSCYAESKRMAETLAACWAHQNGLHAVVVRPFHTYGPGVPLDDGRVFADFVADVVAGRDIVMKSDGSAMRAFCYVADATEGFFTVLLKGESGVAYNVGDPTNEVSIRHLAQLLVGLRGDLGLEVRMDLAPRGDDYAPSPISRNAPDIRRIAELGWQPRTALAEGFDRMIASYA